jgi:hypothetical protein
MSKLAPEERATKTVKDNPCRAKKVHTKSRYPPSVSAAALNKGGRAAALEEPSSQDLSGAARRRGHAGAADAARQQGAAAKARPQGAARDAGEGSDSTTKESRARK